MDKSVAELRRYGVPVEWSGFVLVTLHPLSDEEELLGRLAMSPLDCNSCDLYWSILGRLVFVSVESSPESCPFTSFHIKENVSDGQSFYVRTAERPLSKSSIVRVLVKLKTWIDANAEVFESLPAGRTIRVADDDLISG